MSLIRNFRICGEFAVGAVLLLALAPPGVCQEASVTETDTSDTIDEVTVFGKKSIVRLRREMYKAQEVAFDSFNSMNSNDELDVHCFKEAVTGSHVMRRVCRANYVGELVSAATAQWLRDRQLGIKRPFRYPIAKIKAKDRFLQEEMATLVVRQPELARVLSEFSSAVRILESERKRRCEGRFLICRR
ncbi:MAG: hypothetical protein ACI88G_000258 [Woeseiaceae bacterium]|jgi:hypothetical protein